MCQRCLVSDCDNDPLGRGPTAVRNGGDGDSASERSSNAPQSDSASDQSSNAPQSNSASERSFNDPQSLAKAIGCTYGGSDIEEEGVKEGGSCGDEVRIFTFASNENRDNWFAVAQDPGRKYLVGDKWVVSADTAATLTAAQEKIGGEIN